MAVVYSWGLANNRVGYIADPDNLSVPLVADSELVPSKIDIVREWVKGLHADSDDYGKSVYTDHFNMLKKMAPDTDLGKAEEYINVGGDCETLRGPRGYVGAQGSPGLQGPAGPAGPRGVRGVSSSVAFIYKLETDVSVTPADPVGGVWDWENARLYSESIPKGWSTNDELGKGFIWMSNRTFYTEDSETQKTKWSKPARITGESGKPGEDGKSMQFVFCRLANDLGGVVPGKPFEKMPGTEDDDETYVSQDKKYTWLDHPQGITIDYKIEWVSNRVFIKNDKESQWSEWSEPTIWARWGDQGQDGDGIEYIYFRNGGGLPYDKPGDNPSSWSPDSEEFQKDEYLGPGNLWTDSPSGVSGEIGKNFEWVSTRKKKKGKWESFSEPVVWSHYGEKGESGLFIKIMYSTTPSSSVIPLYTPDAVNPGSSWLSTIPEKYDPNGKNKCIWAIECTLDASTMEFYNGSTWSKPYIVTGADGADGIVPHYSMSYYSLPKTVSNPETGKQELKIPEKPFGSEVQKVVPELDTNLNYQGWYDAPNGPGHWYQCVASVNGYDKTIEWGDVVDTMGKPGADGTYDEIRFTVVPSGIIPQIDPGKRVPDVEPEQEYKWLLPDEIEGYNISTEEMWQTVAKIRVEKYKINYNDEDFQEREILVKNWSAPFRISGERGPVGEKGATGEQGFSGLPGVGFAIRYHLGDETGPKDIGPGPSLVDAHYDKNDIDTDKNFPGWKRLQSELEKEKEGAPEPKRLYTWIIQARSIRVGDFSGGETDPSKVEVVEKFVEGEHWSEPILLNGIKGEPGDKAPIIYPEGNYDPKKPYTITGNKAPYVYDSKYKDYYIFNQRFTGEPGQIWIGGKEGDTEKGITYEAIIDGVKYENIPSQNGMTPGDYSQREGGSYIWERMDKFEALYTKVGIIANGLIGEAVFNNQFMFSQYGKDNSKNETNKYDGFLDGYEYRNNKYYLASDPENEELATDQPDPYDKVNSFHPNYCVNFETGEVWMATGAMYIGKDGTTTWGKEQYGYSDNPIGDISFVKDVFKQKGKTEITPDGVVLANFIGVSDTNGDPDSDVKAFINGSTSFKDDESGTLMFASGMNSLVKKERLYRWDLQKKDADILNGLNGTSKARVLNGGESASKIEPVIFTTVDLSLNDSFMDNSFTAYEIPNLPDEKDYNVNEITDNYFYTNSKGNQYTISYDNYRLNKSYFNESNGEKTHNYDFLHFLPFVIVNQGKPGITDEVEKMANPSYVEFPTPILFKSRYDHEELDDTTKVMFNIDNINPAFITKIDMEKSSTGIKIYATKTNLNPKGPDLTEEFIYHSDVVDPIGRKYNVWKKLSSSGVPFEDGYYYFTKVIYGYVNGSITDTPGKINLINISGAVYTPYEKLSEDDFVAMDSSDANNDSYLPNIFYLSRTINRYVGNKVLHYSKSSVTGPEVEPYKIAPTRIFSNGSIITDRLFTNNGIFKGTIQAGGTFLGELKNARGTLSDVDIDSPSIKDASISLGPGSGLNVYDENGSQIVSISNDNILKAGGGCNATYSFSTRYWNEKRKESGDVERGEHHPFGSFIVEPGGLVHFGGYDLTVSIYDPRKDAQYLKYSIYLKVEDLTTGDVQTIYAINRTGSWLSPPGREYDAQWSNFHYVNKAGSGNYENDTGHSVKCTYVAEWHIMYLPSKRGLDYGSAHVTIIPSNVTVSYKTEKKQGIIGKNGFKFNDGNGTEVSMITDQKTSETFIKMVSKENGIIINNSGVQILGNIIHNK